MFWSVAGILISLALLYAGAEGLVRGSASVALRLGLTPLMIGLTIVAYGTSMPELIVSTRAALDAQGGIAVGNVVGSNIFNICIILGLSVLVCPMNVKAQLVRIDTPLCIAASIMGWVVLRDGHLSRVEGAGFLLLIAAYTVGNVVLAKREPAMEVVEEFREGLPAPSRSVGFDILFIVAGLAVLFLGSRLLVENAIHIARSAGVSDAIIGLTIVAAGTSMPELATSIVAALRKEPDIAIGNVVGSNIYNIWAILGCSAVVAPMDAEGISSVDAGLMIASAMLLQLMLVTHRRLVRIEGAILLLIYVGYLAWLWPKT